MSEFTFRLLSLIIVIQFNYIISIDEIDVHHSNLRRWIKWKPPHSIHKETKVLESYFDVIIKRILWNPIPTGCSQWRFHSDVLAKGTAGFFWTCSKEEEIGRSTTGTVYGSVRLEIIDVSLEYASNRDYVRFEFDIKKIFQEKDIIFIIGMSFLKKKNNSHTWNSDWDPFLFQNYSNSLFYFDHIQNILIHIVSSYFRVKHDS